jgi:hypothetical protein
MMGLPPWFLMSSYRFLEHLTSPMKVAPGFLDYAAGVDGKQHVAVDDLPLFIHHAHPVAESPS